MTVLSIEFCQIEMPKGADFSFDFLIASAMNLNGEDRSRKVRDAYLRLQESSQNLDLFFGDMIRLKMSDYQSVIGSLDGIVEPIELARNQGIGEQTAFLYHPGTRVLAYHRTQSGAQASSIMKYFQEIGSLSEPIGSSLIMKKSAIKDIARMNYVKKFHFKVAGLSNPGAVFSGDDEAVGFIRQVSKVLSGPVLELSLSSGKFNEPLDKGRITKLAEALSSLRPKTQNEKLDHIGPKTIEIAGYADDNSPISIDLVRDRIREKIKLSTSATGPLSYSNRLDAVKRAWIKRKDEIQELYGS